MCLFPESLCKLVSYRLCGESSGFVLARTVSVTVLEALWVSPCLVPRDCIPAVSQQLTQHMHMSAAQAETCILPRPKGVIQRKPFPVHNMPDFSQGHREEKNTVVRICWEIKAYIIWSYNLRYMPYLCAWICLTKRDLKYVPRQAWRICHDSSQLPTCSVWRAINKHWPLK